MDNFAGAEIAARWTFADTQTPAAAPEADGRDVVGGLSASLKTLPPKYFYDDAGSHLFEQITDLPEYYLTRTEQSILAAHAADIAALAGPADLVELGSGSARKTRLLIDALSASPSAGAARLLYAPIDVSEAAIAESAEALAAAYPRLAVHGLVGTYEAGLAALPARAAAHRLVLFLGSTIGNMDDAEAAAFFATVAGALAPGDRLLMGFDLVKPAAIIDAAYNDSQGVTAAFNLNMLRHLNRRYEADFDLRRFSHRAFFDPATSRIEMHLVSAAAQRVRFKRLDFTASFAAGETIRTEISRKFRLPAMIESVSRHGLAFERHWSDPQDWFALAMFRRA